MTRRGRDGFDAFEYAVESQAGEISDDGPDKGEGFTD